jgi:hypothetical protein
LHDPAENITILPEKVHATCMHKMNAGSTVCNTHGIVFTIMHRETFIAKLTEIQQTVEQLLAQLQASEQDKIQKRGITSAENADSEVRKGDSPNWHRY